MEEKILFEEKQQFRQWWLWLLFVLLKLFILYKIVIKNDFGNASKTTGIITMLLMFSILVLFYFINMKTKVYKDRIEITFFPFKIHKVYPFTTIEKMEVLK